MRQLICIVIVVFGLWRCNHKTSDNSAGKSTDILDGKVQQDSNKVMSFQEKQPVINTTEAEVDKDSTVYFSDSMFTHLELNLKEISQNIFRGYEKTYKPVCALDSNGFIKGKGLILNHYCKDICESYLVDEKNSIKMPLPTDYDGGISGILFSPSCNQFVVYSSYDGPGYTGYYDYRAEIFGFTITQHQGYKAVKPSFKYYTKDWSLENVTWINDNTIALKTYKENRTLSNQDNLYYRYFKTVLNKGKQ